MNALKPFRDFNFGWAAAETEASRNPELLKAGFLDLHGKVTELLSGDRFLVLGGKGTGKSAIAEHLKLTIDELASGTGATFVHVAKLKDCRSSDLAAIVKGQAEQLPTAWSWLLLVSLFASFKLAGGNIASDPELASIHRILETSHLLPSPDNLEGLIRDSRRKAFSEGLPAAFEIEQNQEGGLGRSPTSPNFHFPVFVGELLSSMLRFKSTTRHLLIFDDTDELPNLREDSLRSLSALLLETVKLNQEFAKAQVQAKIVLLFRTELFERLPATTNKIRQDYSFRLDWYSSDENVSPLWKVANQRAKLQCGSEIDIVDAYFPAQVARGTSDKLRVLPRNASSTRGYLLRHTRHTPRDFVMLLQYIQGYTQGTSVTNEAIVFGLQEYASAYFKNEITDELRTYIDSGDISRLMDEIGRKRDNLFRFESVRGRIPERMRDRLPDMLNAMFDCSCLGNWERDEGVAKRTYRYKFPHCRLDLSRPMVLHPALSMAFNLRADDEADDVPERTLHKGRIISINPHHGLIQAADGRVFYFNAFGVVDRQNKRLCQDDDVTFKPVEGRREGNHLLAEEVQLLLKSFTP